MGECPSLGNLPSKGILPICLDKDLNIGNPSDGVTTAFPLPESDLSTRDEGTKSLQPFLRWAGGKRQLLPALLRALPPGEVYGTYYEPFLGAGTLFFALTPQRAILSDANAHLIKCYQYVRRCSDCVYRNLEKHRRKTSEKYFYNLRDTYNSSRFSFEQAARFIYLNKTCFNGIFRVNQNGNFNVPYGWKEPPCLPTCEELRIVGKALRRAKLRSCGFGAALRRATKGDFVYLDPPYPPLNDTAYFTHYTKDRFVDDDQVLLAKEAERLADLGCYILMSNADTPLIRKLYSNFKLKKLRVTRFLTCKMKHCVAELLITNYEY